MQDEDESLSPKQQIPSRHTNGVIRPPERADRELAERLREYGSDPFVAVAALARALAQFEEDSGSRSNAETAALLELPERINKLGERLAATDKRVSAVEFPVGIGKWIAMILCGGMLGGIGWASHVINANGEERGAATEQAKTFKSDIEQLKASKADVGAVDVVRGAVEELKRDVRYLERHEDKR